MTQEQDLNCIFTKKASYLFLAFLLSSACSPVIKTDARLLGKASDHTGVLLDNQPLKLTVNQAESQTDPAASFPVEFDVIFSKTIQSATFTAEDITQTGSAQNVLWEISNPSGDSKAFVLRAAWASSAGTIQPTIAAQRVLDPAGNPNQASTSTDNTVMYDPVSPAVTGLSDDSTPTKSKTWNWGCSKADCTYRFVVDTNPATDPSGAYGATATATQDTGTGTYYIHVQAKDAAGNESAVVHVSAVIDNTPPDEPSGLSLVSPASSPDYHAEPTVRISGVVNGDTVELHSNSDCSALRASGITTGGSIDLTSDPLIAGSYTFFARAIDGVGNASSCSSASVIYERLQEVAFLAWDSDSSDFGVVTRGTDSSTITFTLRNEGTDVASGCGSPLIIGAQADQFAQTSETCGVADLAVAASCEVVIKAHPTSEGVKTATLRRTCGGINGEIAITVNGIAPEPVAITPTTKMLSTNEKYQFSPFGGIPGYSWSVSSGLGSIDATGVYTAPLVSDAATLRVTDSEGVFASSNVTTAAFQQVDDHALDQIPFAVNRANALALDSTGAPIVAGKYGNLVLFSRWIVRKWNGSTFEVIDDFDQGGNNSEAFGVKSDHMGRIWVVGRSADTVSARWVVRRWEGSEFVTVDNYALSAGKSAQARAIAIDENGVPYVSGFAMDSSNVSHWIVRKWNGSAFVTVDNYNYISGKNSQAQAIGIDGSGAPYVAGYGQDSSSVSHWIVRKWNGSAFVTLDDYNLTAGKTSSAGGMAFDGSGIPYVVGYGFDGSLAHWIVRKWNGTEFETIDDYNLVSDKAAYATAISFDSSGVCHVVGYSTDESGVSRWITRKWNESAFVTVDNYILQPGYPAYASALVFAGDGTPLVAGYANDDSGVNHIVVRNWNGSEFSTLDEYTRNRFVSRAQSVAVDGSGVPYVAGYLSSSTGYRWVVRKWNGSEFVTIDDYSLVPGKSAYANSIAIDPDGIPYVAGYALDALSYYHWIVRKWNGSEFETIDDYMTPAGGFAMANSIAIDGNGIPYVAGRDYINSSSHWVVRKWNGSEFETIDDYNRNSERSAIATSIAIDSNGVPYVAGEANDTSGITHWIVRKWNGSGFVTIDDYNRASGKMAYAVSLSIDDSDTPYVVGHGVDSSNLQRWIVRKWNGSSFSTVDDFNLVSGRLSVATSVLALNENTIYVAGFGRESSSDDDRWVVRKWNGQFWSTIREQPGVGSGIASLPGSQEIYCAGIFSDLEGSRWRVEKESF